MIAEPSELPTVLPLAGAPVTGDGPNTTAAAVLAELRAIRETLAVTSQVLIDGETVARLLGISLSTLHQVRARGDFGPSPVTIPGTRSVRFLRSEVVQWAASPRKDGNLPTAKEWAAIRSNSRAGGVA